MQLDERHVDVAAGELADVTLSLTPAHAEDEPTSAAGDDAYLKSDEEVVSSGNTEALVMGIVTGVLAVGAGTMAYVTVRAQDKYNATRTSDTPTTLNELNSERRNALRKAWVTDGLLAAAAVSAIITTILLVTGGDDEPSSAALDFKLGLTGASLQGRF